MLRGKSFPLVRRRFVRRLILATLVAGWTAAGLLGAFSYVNNYYQHRGFAVLTRARGIRPGRQLWVHFYSPALRRRYDYLVYLPTGYDPAKRYPVYYLLHGLPGRPQAFIRIASIDVRLDNLIGAHRLRPMILVFPDGRIDGNAQSDSEWADSPAGAYASYVVDVVHDVDHRFSTLASRGARVIAGYSAGAYGALNIALHHLAIFSSVQVWSGYFRQTASGVFAHASASELASNSPAEYLPRVRRLLRREALRVFIYSGRGDHDSAQTKPMAAELGAAGARVSWALYAGGHDWALWHGHLNQMLFLAARDMSTSIGARHRVRRHQGRTRRHRPSTSTLHRSASAVARASAFSVSGAPAFHPATRSDRSHGASLGTLVGLVLALLSAAAINVGFLLQHRGLLASGPRARAWESLRAAIGSPAWIGGQALGIAGFAVQIAAVAIAPLSLVQAFAAGGLALSVPLASGLFGHRVGRSQAAAILLVAAALASLPLGLSGAGERIHGSALIGSMAAAGALGSLMALIATLPEIRFHRALLAAAAGLFYGVADAAIKAIAVRWSAHGSAELASGWMALALVATFAGFICFQGALRGEAVSAISLMTAVAALTALACGLLGFAESLGTSAAVVVAHLAALAGVLGCVPVLARAQAAMADPGERAAVGAPREGAAEREQNGFDPRSQSRPTGEQHVTEAIVAGNGERSLREQQEQARAEHTGNGGAPRSREPDDRYAGEKARR